MMQDQMIPALAGHDAPHDPCPAILEHIPATVTLTYVDYRDELSDEQVSELLKGDDGRLGVEEQVWEWFEEGAYTACESVLREACEAAGVDVDDLSDDCADNLREVIRDRDDSNPLRDLIRNTGRKLFRYDLSADVDGSDETENRQAVADAIGIPADDARISELLGNAGYGGALYLLWSGDIADAMRVAEGPQGVGTLTIDGAEILALDRYNGSGWSVEIGHPVTVVWHAGRVSHDYAGRGRGGWSWSDTTGGVYLPEATVTTQDA